VPLLTPHAFRQATGLASAKADEWYASIMAACLEFDINTRVRITAFLAQVAHESGTFLYTSEIWGPTPAQMRYKQRADLGNTEPEALRHAYVAGVIDVGKFYRGHGLIQITGFYNHKKAALALGVPADSDPAILASKSLAARSAAWWWKAHGCNELADAGDFVALTRRINGGVNGLADRQVRYARAQAAITVQGVA